MIQIYRPKDRVKAFKIGKVEKFHNDDALIYQEDLKIKPIAVSYLFTRSYSPCKGGYFVILKTGKYCYCSAKIFESDYELDVDQTGATQWLTTS